MEATNSNPSPHDENLDFAARIESMKTRLKEVKPELFGQCQDCGKSVFHFHRRCTPCDEAKWAAMSTDERSAHFSQDIERLDELLEQTSKLVADLQGG